MSWTPPPCPQRWLTNPHCDVYRAKDLKMLIRAIIVRTLRRAPSEAIAVLAALSFAALDAYFLVAGHAALNP
jgi:hypothetical protein